MKLDNLEQEQEKKIFENIVHKIKNEVKDKKYKSISELMTEYKLKSYSAEISKKLQPENKEYKYEIKTDNDSLYDQNNLIKEIFDSKANEIKIIQNDDSYVIFEIEKINQSLEPNLEQIKDKVKLDLSNQLNGEKISQFLHQLINNLKKSNNIDELLKNYPDLIIKKGIEIENPILEKISGKQENEDYPYNFRMEIANSLNGVITEPIKINDSYFIAIIKETKPIELDSEARNKLKNALDYNLFMNESNEIFAAILNQLKKKYKIVRKND